MKRSVGLLGGALALAAAVFWGTMLTESPKSEAETMIKFDSHEALATASKDAPTQDASAVACAYVLTDGYRCN
jgi:hypothetical protein